MAGGGGRVVPAHPHPHPPPHPLYMPHLAIKPPHPTLGIFHTIGEDNVLKHIVF